MKETWTEAPPLPPAVSAAILARGHRALKRPPRAGRAERGLVAVFSVGMLLWAASAVVVVA